jgi:Flp pilus assembly protein TadD
MSGMILLLQGRASDATALFDQALAFDGQNAHALWGAGMALVALGRFDQGIAMPERATPLQRGGFVHGLLGWALAVAGRTDEARRVLDELRARPVPRHRHEAAVPQRVSAIGSCACPSWARSSP